MRAYLYNGVIEENAHCIVWSGYKLPVLCILIADKLQIQLYLANSDSGNQSNRPTLNTDYTEFAEKNFCAYAQVHD